MTKEHSPSAQIKAGKRRNSGSISSFPNAELSAGAQRTVTEFCAWPTSHQNKKHSTSRRRVVIGLGSFAAAAATTATGLLSRRLSAQGSTNAADVLIIGGGIAGASTAFHLAEQGRDVLLLERGEIASDASGQNMGGLGGAGWGEPQFAVLPDGGQCRDLQAHAARPGL